MQKTHCLRSEKALLVLKEQSATGKWISPEAMNAWDLSLVHICIADEHVSELSTK